MASPIPTAYQANSPYRPSPAGATPASPPNKRDLKSWWKGFKLPSKQHDQPSGTSRAPGIFGVPLRQSITYANVAISLIDENGQSYIYGYVPIVVAKCATGVEGIFRLSGSEKRIKELKQIFDSPDRYGKGLVWEGYTVHDAANVLRRYLNDLPEPVVPLGLYEQFRDPLRGATKQPSGDAEGPQFVDNFDESAAIRKYQQLITELPPLNRQLLLYILDLLAVFAAKSDENRMNSQNLAAIFQPGMLSHPSHAMAPEEYRLNQCVLIFLIENQDHFLIGMQGTAADENTKKEVESGTPTNSNVKGVTRTASNASAGANSVRKEGQLRRNRSVSSKHSRGEGSIGCPSPPQVTPTPGGLARSNTVPSKKSPALAGSKFRKTDSPGHGSPARVEPMTPVRTAIARPESRTSSPVSAPPVPVILTAPGTTAVSGTGRSQERLVDISQESTSSPAKERHLPTLFQRSPAEGGEKRQPNKLRKKRIPGSMSISAHSSNASLPHSNAASPAVEHPNPMESIHPISQQIIIPTSATPTTAPEAQSAIPQPTSTTTNTTTTHDTSKDAREMSPAVALPLRPDEPHDTCFEVTPRASEISSDKLHPDDSKLAAKSPPTSIHSSFNDGSDLDQILEGQTGSSHSDNPERERKKLWRLSRSRKDENGGSSGSSGGVPLTNLWSNTGAEISTTTIGSGASRPSKSLTQDGSEGHATDHVGSPDGDRENNGKDDPRGPIGWIKNKYREAKENVEQRRNKSPHSDRFMDRQALNAALHSRGKSLEIKGESNIDEKAKEKQDELAEPAVASTATTILTEAPSLRVHDTPEQGAKCVEEMKPLATESQLATVPEVSTEMPIEQAHESTETDQAPEISDQAPEISDQVPEISTTEPLQDSELKEAAPALAEDVATEQDSEVLPTALPSQE
ncbi:hypothetical protein E4U43_002222 [Claviceps pusilla]|uniref:Rho-GAP domain-containing protein n=1 Tax=Claviceps pusilla TaxID=123648 RepID=A0A9P7SYI8_9HYPO|nr:hypothetical protein E4U43_002222 [Claviceps pusilla]